jgi:hypothetical protein
MVGLHVVEHENDVSVLHELFDTILEASIQVGFLVLIILEVIVVLHEEIYLNICDLSLEVIVHQNALFIFADVVDIVVYEINVKRISQLLVVNYDVAVGLIQPTHCEQRLFEGSGEL